MTFMECPLAATGTDADIPRASYIVNKTLLVSIWGKGVTSNTPYARDFQCYQDSVARGVRIEGHVIPVAARSMTRVGSPGRLVPRNLTSY